MPGPLGAGPSRHGVRPPGVLVRVLPGGPRAGDVGSGSNILETNSGYTVGLTRSTPAYDTINGILVAAAASIPRINSQGFFCELAATNSIATQAGGTNNAVTKALDATGPDGVSSVAYTITCNAGSANHFENYGFTKSANKWSFSVYLKAGTIHYVRVGTNDGQISIDLNTGSVVATNGTVGSYSITALANGWYRFEMFQTYGAGGGDGFFMSVGSTVNQVTVSTGEYIWNAAGTETILYYGAQLLVCQYTPTVRTDVLSNRITAGDVLRITGDSTWTGKRMEMGCTFVPWADPVAQRSLLAVLGGSSSSAQIRIKSTGELELQTFETTSDLSTSSVLTWTLGQAYRVRARWDGDGGTHEVYRDDVLVASGSGLTKFPLAIISQFTIGADTNGANQCNGYLRDIFLRMV